MDPISPILAPLAAHLAARGIKKVRQVATLSRRRKKAAVQASMVVASVATTYAVAWLLALAELAPRLSAASSLDLLVMLAEGVMLAGVAMGLWSEGKKAA